MLYGGGDWVTIANDRFGQRWIPWDTLTSPTSLVMGAVGQLLNVIPFLHYPFKAAAGKNDKIYFLTRFSIAGQGPMYCLNTDGSLEWRRYTPFQPFFGSLVQHYTISTDGSIYLGGSTKGECGCTHAFGRVVRIDPDNGNVVSVIPLPGYQQELNKASVIVGLAGSPDGTVWAAGSWADALLPGSLVNNLFNIEGNVTKNKFVSPGGNSDSWIPRVDAKGNVYVIGNANSPPLGMQIVEVDKDTGGIVYNYEFPGSVTGYAFGPSGEELFATYAISVNDRYLARVNTVTKQMSIVPTDPAIVNSYMAPGDPTGFIFANVVDRDGDNDNDSFTNGAETAAGSNPFDSTSVPSGPKVYITFTPQDTIRVLYRDPDGILSPTGGIVNLNFIAGSYGDVTGFLFQYITNVSLSPDGKDLTVDFGNYTVPHNLKVRLEANVWDAAGAHGYDWQFTPPGIGPGF
ncbi:MAG: hypothetical protein ACKVS6_15155 [Planctomycetota bacterium]